ncbi:CBU_0592 family membrane protein [Kribbella deserti]|uniref:CBU-0592-like domain-containing protein n=1 Tax=Kribbella deserti TaxID=1926257 RepID=A0ABV6QE49_9ACTN
MQLVDVIEIAGALTILAAFAASQAGRLEQRTRTYQLLNLIGSAILAVLAGMHQSWGFLLLEGSWAVVSLFGLIAVLRKPHAA